MVKRFLLITLCFRMGVSQIQYHSHPLILEDFCNGLKVKAGGSCDLFQE